MTQADQTFAEALESYRTSVLLGDKDGQDAAAETLRSLASRPSFKADVAVMKESTGFSYYVTLKRSDLEKGNVFATAADGYITPSRFKNRDHAEGEARDWNLFFGNEVGPDPLDIPSTETAFAPMSDAT